MSETTLDRPSRTTTTKESTRTEPLDTRIALVTGAGQGIGQGIAYALAAHGARVAVVGRTLTKLEATVTEIQRRGGTAIAIGCDVTHPDEIESAVERTVEHFGGLHIVVNNAQEFTFGTIDEITLDSVDVGWRSGPLATLLFMRAARPHLSGGGTVVNVSSGAAVDTGIAGVGVYSAAKSAIESLSRAAAVEWAADGVRVVTVMPLARTPSVAAVLNGAPDLEEGLLSGVPLGRFGDPETEIGRTVAFLCGPDASFITGTTVSIDGGSVRLR